MAGETTAELIFAPRTIWGELHGEVGGRIWRPGFAAFLVEKHVPLWVVTPVSHASKSNPSHTIITCNPDLGGPLEMNLMPFMASVFSNDLALKEQAKFEGVLFNKIQVITNACTGLASNLCGFVSLVTHEKDSVAIVKIRHCL